MKTAYKIKLGKIERELELFSVADNLKIAAIIILGDPELTKVSAEELLKLAPKYDCLLTAECKSIPLIHEMASMNGDKRYVVARKGHKVYLKNAIKEEVKSITTQNVQTLYLGEGDANYIKGKNVLIVDDVISTGESLSVMESLVKRAGGNIVGKMAILAEGDAANRDDIIFLQKLPLFDNDGEPI